MAAVVAAQTIGRTMDGESDAATGTTLDFTTGGTLQEGGEATPVEQ
jgi:hypothetical protein